MSKRLAQLFGTNKTNPSRDTCDGSDTSATSANFGDLVPKEQCENRKIGEFPSQASQTSPPDPRNCARKCHKPFLKSKIGASGGVAEHSDGTVAQPPQASPIIWDGDEIDSGVLSLDTETSLIKGHEIPQLALVSVSDGRDTWICDPDHLPTFMELHLDRDLVFHNAAFDFWVLCQHLERDGHHHLIEQLWRAVDEGRVHDTMLLDALVRLGREGAITKMRNLAEVAAEWGGVKELNKDDPYRTRYGEIIGLPYPSGEPHS